jgi:hypothetical protein
VLLRGVPLSRESLVFFLPDIWFLRFWMFFDFTRTVHAETDAHVEEKRRENAARKKTRKVKEERPKGRFECFRSFFESFEPFCGYNAWLLFL